MTDTAADLIYDVMVVGAGICGLMAADRLLEQGASVILLDKGRSVGGRLATRRIGAGRADHGAQFFTVRAPRFQRYVDAWAAEKLVFTWSTGWSDGSLAVGTGRDGHPRYAVHGGMAALPKHLAALHGAKGAEIATNVKIVAAAPGEPGWVVTAENGQTWHGRSLVLTPPVPQSLGLLDAGGVALPVDQRRALAAITYAPCLCAMVVLNGTAWLPAPGAVQRPHEDLSWIADNQRKGISPQAAVLTLHGSPTWSTAHFDDPDDELMGLFNAALQPWLTGSQQLRHAEIKRWRYALSTVIHPQPYLRGEGLPPLFLGGDGFGSPRIEGAALSGLALADELIAVLG